MATDTFRQPSAAGTPFSRRVVRWFALGMFGLAAALIAFVMYVRQPDPPYDIGAEVRLGQNDGLTIEFATSDPLFVYILLETPNEIYALSPRRADGPHKALAAGNQTVQIDQLPEPAGEIVLLAAQKPLWWIDEAIHKIPRSAPQPILDAELFAELLPPEEREGRPGPAQLATPLEAGSTRTEGVWIRRTPLLPS